MWPAEIVLGPSELAPIPLFFSTPARTSAAASSRTLRPPIERTGSSTAHPGASSERSMAGKFPFSSPSSSSSPSAALSEARPAASSFSAFSGLIRSLANQLRGSKSARLSSISVTVVHTFLACSVEAAAKCVIFGELQPAEHHVIEIGHEALFLQRELGLV